MPAPDGTISLAIDFDGTLVEKDVQPLRWRPKAKEFVIGAAAAGFRQWLWSCRCASAANLVDSTPWDAEDFWRSGRVSADVAEGWRLYAEMRDFLEAEGVWALLQPWTLPGKPQCDAYIDDKGEAPDMYRLARELGVPLANAHPGGSEAALRPRLDPPPR